MKFPPIDIPDHSTSTPIFTYHLNLEPLNEYLIASPHPLMVRTLSLTDLVIWLLPVIVQLSLLYQTRDTNNRYVPSATCLTDDIARLLYTTDPADE